MKSLRVSLISLTIVVVILAADFAWLRQAIVGGSSIFGFDALGFDTLILPMATILALGLHHIVSRRPWTHRSLLGFEACGGLVVLASALCGWVFPNAVRIFLHPAYLLWGLWSPRNPPNLYQFLTITFSITVTQLLIAAAGGWLAENQGVWVLRMPRVRFTIWRMMVVVAIAALVSTGLAQWLRYRQENDPWKNAVRWSEDHEARANEHIEAAQRYPETAMDRLRMAKFEKTAASSFRAEAKRLKP